MRSRVRKFAHVLERLGLAMAGAASGLFVAIHVGSATAGLNSQAFLLIMMLSGGIGFYLGIDTPPLPLQPPTDQSPRGRIDAAELQSAVGTFLAALTAFGAVALIVLRHEPHRAWTVAIMVGWVFGVAMQTVAGTIARTRGVKGWPAVARRPQDPPLPGV